MVNYNAFNVDPNKYQQQAMGNFSNAMQIRNQNQQAADRNALYKQQQADLQAQRQAANALEQQRVNELQKRTVIDQQQADQQGQYNQIRGFATALNMAQYGETPEEQQKIMINTLKATGVNVEEGSPFLPSFPRPGHVVVPVGEGSDGNPLGTWDLEGTQKSIGAVLDTIKENPSIMQDEVAFASMTNKFGVKAEAKKGWSEKPKIEKPSVAELKFAKEQEDEFIDSYIENALFTDENFAPLVKDVVKKDGVYGTYVENNMGETKFVPTTGRVRKQIIYLKNRAKQINNKAKRENIPREQAAYDYEVSLAKAEEKRRKEQEKERRDLARAADANTTKIQKQKPGKSEKKYADNKYGERIDGTKKSSGFLGELKMKDGSGKIATELSVGVKINGEETEIPTLVPTLTQAEVSYLLRGGEPTQAIVDKAAAHAKKRIAEGKSPFARSGESSILGRNVLKTPEEIKERTDKRIKRQSKSFMRTPPNAMNGSF
jgi:hypothetical protein